MTNKLDFPTNASLGQKFQDEHGLFWAWNGSGWVRQSDNSSNGYSQYNDNIREAATINDMIKSYPIKQGDITLVAENGKIYKNRLGSNGDKEDWVVINNGSSDGSLSELPDLAKLITMTTSGKTTIELDFSKSGVYPSLTLTNILTMTAKNMRVGATQKIEITTHGSNPKEPTTIFDPDIFTNIPLLFESTTYRFRLVAMPNNVIWIDLVSFYIVGSA